MLPPLRVQIGLSSAQVASRTGICSNVYVHEMFCCPMNFDYFWSRATLDHPKTVSKKTCFSPRGCCMIFRCPPSSPSSSPPQLPLLRFLSSAPSPPHVLWLSTNAVQLPVPIGDNGQLMSSGWPVLWLSTNAILAVPIGDDGQLMSSAWPVLWLSTFSFLKFTMA